MNGTYLLKALAGFCLSISTPLLLAAPAVPHTILLSQPDGPVVEGQRVGDEWCNRIETAAGFTIHLAGDGVWYYVAAYDDGQLVSSQIRAEQSPVGLIPHVAPSCRAPSLSSPTRGASAFNPFTGHILFLLASFTNRAGTYSEADFASFLEYDIDAYYNTVSYGAVSLLPADESFGTANNGVVGWLNLGYDHPNTGGNTGRKNQKLTKDAILASNDYVDYASYDINRDGYVGSDELAIVVVVAGYEAAYGAYTPSVWGHKSDLSSVGPANVDGVIVGATRNNSGGYCQFGEIHQSNENDGHQATVGIMVHELGHLIFRLPDLYDYDGSSYGAGAWCVMSYGSWGYAFSDAWYGETPVMPSAWVKMTLGWASATPVNGNVSLVASGSANATASNSLFRASSNKSTEYFLVENRQPTGYDRGLEGSLGASFGGIAIWHVDASVTGNNNDTKRLTDIEEADASIDAFAPTNLWSAENPVSMGLFNLSSTPSSRLNNGRSSGVSITNFSTSGEIMTATLSGL